MILFPYTLLFFVLLSISIAAPTEPTEPTPDETPGPDSLGKVFYAYSSNWGMVRVVS